MSSPQRALPIYGQDVPQRRVHKKVRTTSREVYRYQRALDQVKAESGIETREGQVLRCLAAFWNRFQNSPTALELLHWMETQGERVFDVNSIRPRLRELFERGLIESAGKRPCIVSSKTVHTWRVREIGGMEQRD